jgi:hypothetical protein
MFDKIAAAIGLAACLAVWIGMALGPARRQRLLHSPTRAWRHWHTRRLALREAADVIERARRRGPVEREGNVYRPRSFDRRGDDETLH